MIEKSNIESILEKEGIFVSTISGYSMSPMLKDRRDTVVIAATSGELKKFDVALYKVGEKYVLHRVIKVLENEYVTCGDNCILLERIPKEAVIGKLIEVWRGEEKLDLDSPEYLAYVRRRVAGFYPRAAYRRARRLASSLRKKVFKK